MHGLDHSGRLIETDDSLGNFTSARTKKVRAVSAPTDDGGYRRSLDRASSKYHPCGSPHSFVRRSLEIFDRLRLGIYRNLVESINEALYASHNPLAERGIQGHSFIAVSLACHATPPRLIVGPDASNWLVAGGGTEIFRIIFKFGFSLN
jgi:hypothetical protein